MKKLVSFILPATMFFAAASFANASTINVSNNTFVNLQTNDDLLFYISADSFCNHQFGDSGEIQMILGAMPQAGPMSPIPGTSGVYMAGMLFNSTVEPQNGSFSIPLTDSDAARTGMPSSDILLIPGSRGGGSYSGPIDLLSARVDLTPTESAALFASGEAIISVHNLGSSLSFGYPGTSISDDFSASLYSADGSHSMGAHVLRVECVRNNVPEPGTVGLFIIGLTIIATRLARRRFAR